MRFLLPSLLLLAACQVSGQPWDENDECWRWERPVGRVGDPDQGCNTMQTTATSPSGRCWRFRDSCIPRGFVEGCDPPPTSARSCSEEDPEPWR